jgi:pimeloyl-ACP methyl ester carboxylesterase
MSEYRALTALLAKAADGIAVTVRDVHRATAKRSFPSSGAAAKLAHDGIAELVYGCVRGGLATGAAVAAALPSEYSLQRTPRGRAAHAILNGYIGDQLHETDDPLAVPMALRKHDADIPTTAAALREHYPDASPRVVLFVHGLIENENSWIPRDRPDFGSRLHDGLGVTPLYVRYNSGRHISDNGAELGALLERLVREWPVGIRELTIVGHSMGGLVAKSALRQGVDAAATWPSTLTHLVYLGVPHRGSPVEYGANLAAWTLDRVAESAPLARPFRLRSKGIKDLRFGYLVDSDWSGRDQDAIRDAPRGADGTPFPVHINEYFLTVTMNGVMGKAFGDLLVRSRSGLDDVDASEPDRIHIDGLHHFDLLSHDRVYARLHNWLDQDHVVVPPRP